MSIYINDVFWTFQGEGRHAGRRALFIRMPFCNLSCSWCDTTFNTFKKWTREELENKANEEAGTFAVITGGEPLMHAHTPVVHEILDELGFEVAYETNGTMKPPIRKAFITCSPKSESNYEIHPDLYPLVDEFKYVVDEGFNFDLLKRHESDRPEQLHSLSPEFGIMEKSIAAITSFIISNPKWNLSLQTHKWIGIP